MSDSDDDRVILQALTRLTQREAYDRAFRFKRASQCSILHDELPKDQWLAPAEVWARVLPAKLALRLTYCPGHAVSQAPRRERRGRR